VTTRRGFLAGILAAGFAPAAIGSGVLMPVRKIVAPPSYADISTKEMIEYARLKEAVADPFLVFVHRDEVPWWREQIGFIPAQQYASMVPLPMEVGQFSGFRIIASNGPVA
jgi:hypothetical protein